MLVNQQNEIISLMRKYYYLSNNITLYQFKNFLNFKRKEVEMVFKAWAGSEARAFADRHLWSQELAASIIAR